MCFICNFTESGHSDPEKLKETAQDVQRLSPNELKERQVEIKVSFLWWSSNLILILKLYS